jgi:hypothetical protein
METEKIIQIQAVGTELFALTNKGDVYRSKGPGLWERVVLFNEVDKTLKGKKDETARKNKGK